ncbi:hypothetical protein V6N13_080937 [Hibiscus sabdariffa]
MTHQVVWHHFNLKLGHKPSNVEQFRLGRYSFIPDLLSKAADRFTCSAQKGFPSSRSASDGSGGEDSDQFPWGIVQRPTNWSNIRP